jgi:hypothetical protein
MPFRKLDYEKQYQKYQWLEALLEKIIAMFDQKVIMFLIKKIKLSIYGVY